MVLKILNPTPTKFSTARVDSGPKRCPLLQVFDCKQVEDVIIAVPELTEIEGCLMPVLDDGRWAILEDVSAILGAAFEEAQSAISRILCGNDPSRLSK